MNEEEWLDNHKEEIKNINNMVDDLEKDKKVQKVVETFSRWQDPTIEKLQQENQQLKKQNARLTREVCNRLIANYDYSSTLKDELNKERINNIVLKEANKITNEENNQLKEVIEEVREYIDNNTELEHDGDEFGYTEWINIKPQNIVFINELLQILDKVKENK